MNKKKNHPFIRYIPTRKELNSNDDWYIIYPSSFVGNKITRKGAKV